MSNTWAAKHCEVHRCRLDGTTLASCKAWIMVAEMQQTRSMLVRAVPAGSAVQWGAWGATGMASANAAALARIQRSGMGVIAPAAGLAALRAVLSSANAHSPQTIASPFAWAALLASVEAPPPVFAEHAAAAAAPLRAAARQPQRGAVAVVVHTSGSVLPRVLEIVRGMLGPQVRALFSDVC